MTYVSILVHVVVGELHLVEGDVVLHPVTAASGAVGVEIKSENISVNISKCWRERNISISDDFKKFI